MRKITKCFLLIILISSCRTNYSGLDHGIFADINTNKGSILVKLESEKAPITVSNFISLSEGNNPFVSEEFKSKKFYNNLKFHRVINDFMIQGGDPLGNGTGGPGYRFDDEFSDLTHKGPGILSMANSGPNTNGSQFFITHKSTPWLDGKHTVFGEVVKGQEIVDSIEQNDIIKEIIIIRNGRDANNFDASKIFKNYFENREILAEQKEAKKTKIREDNIRRFESLKKKSKLTKSGLQYFVIKKGKGKLVKSTNKAKVHYAVYFVDGTLLETSKEEIAKFNEVLNIQKLNSYGYKPIEAQVGPNDPMIEGFKEGVRLLKEGDKAILFLPYTIAYGKNGTRGIPPQSDLIFEVEIESVY